MADAAGRHRRERGSGEGRLARTRRGDRHQLSPRHRRERVMVPLRSSAQPSAESLGWALLRPATEVVRHALHRQGRRGADREAGAKAGVRRMALGRFERADRADRAVQAGRLRAGDARVRPVICAEAVKRAKALPA